MSTLFTSRLFFLVIILFSSIFHAQEPLKILMVVEKFPSPVQIYVYNQICSLLDQGHEVLIYAKANPHKLEITNIVNQYQLMKRITYILPDSLDNFDIILCQFGSLGVEFAHLKKNEQTTDFSYLISNVGSTLI